MTWIVALGYELGRSGQDLALATHYDRLAGSELKDQATSLGGLVAAYGGLLTDMVTPSGSVPFWISVVVAAWAGAALPQRVDPPRD